jgi:hypothetical protein
MNNYTDALGKQVCKCRSGGAIKYTNLKPFKSGNRINTVKGIILHPILHIPAYIFEEDDSYVECQRCRVFEEG